MDRYSYLPKKFIYIYLNHERILFNYVQIAEKSASLIDEVFIILCTSNLFISRLILLQY